jgi:hypothetical protein
MWKCLWRLETGIFLAFWLTLLVSGRTRLFRDPGSLWHVAVGERILASGELIYTDPFSCTFAGKPWIAQGWLAECLLAVLHRLGGLDSVLLAAATLLACLYSWVAHRLLRAGIHPLLVALILGLTLAASSYHFHPRPHVVTIALVAWTFARLCDFEAGRIPLRSLFWLVPVYAVWANVHGGMVGGVGTLLVTVAGWAVARGLGRESPLTGYRQLFPLGLLVLACSLTALVNPYGTALPRVWFALMGSPVLPQLMEEHARLRSSGLEAATVLGFGLVYGAALAGTWPKGPRVTWLVPLIWLYLAWTRVRHGPLFAVTAALALGEMFPHVRWITWLAHKGSVTCRLRPQDADGLRRRWDWRPGLVPFAVVLAAFTLQALAVPFPVLGRGWVRPDPSACPLEVLPDLRAYEHDRPGGAPIFNDMLFGGFLIYSTPELRVFIDDRCELYGDQWLAQYADVAWHHPERIEQWTRDYGIDRALVLPGSGFDRYLATAPGWALVRRTEAAVLYARRPAEGHTPTGLHRDTDTQGRGSRG